MTPVKKMYTFMLDPDLLAALKTASERNPELSEGGIIRQALREWFERHGVKVKSERKRADTRKRS